ncbi:hypothetical protein [Geoglobus acetivorans]|uniref:Uncharacterized protein n=1 Tax=Geoglobus acetivorans TaxID=565033 RepID=A0A0A7GDW3_GEOAI|nr:hypothetical protein GACE_0998 [Geoglobus acetivorans]
MRFHVAMARAGAVVGYRESEIYVHVPKCRLSTFMAVCRAVVEEFGVSEDDITVTTHDSRDSWIRLTVPLGAGKEVMGEEEVKAALRFDGVTDLVAEPRVVESGSEKGEQSYVKLEKEGNRKVLVKRDGSVSEMRDKLSVEREVIGTPWEVG